MSSAQSSLFRDLLSHGVKKCHFFNGSILKLPSPVVDYSANVSVLS
jgi:hypothetical protein